MDKRVDDEPWAEPTRSWRAARLAKAKDKLNDLSNFFHDVGVHRAVVILDEEDAARFYRVILDAGVEQHVTVKRAWFFGQPTMHFSWLNIEFRWDMDSMIWALRR